MSTERQPPPALHVAEQPQVLSEHIPAGLRVYPQWVCWKYIEREAGQKPDKRPVNSWNLHNAGVHWPNAWSTFVHAYTTYLMSAERGMRGIGFVLTPEDPFVAVDLDGCVTDGEISTSAQEVIASLGSYTELSPSGAGLRLLVSCPEFTDNVRTQSLEVYSHGRFVTITGRHLPGTSSSVAIVTVDQLAALLPANRESVVSGQVVSARPQRAQLGSLQGADLWERIFQEDRHGAEHRRRFNGDTTVDAGDHSLTVIRLLNCLAWWTGCDAVQMRALMLMSPLANEKWSSKRAKADWLEYQIQDAINHVGGRTGRKE